MTGLRKRGFAIERTRHEKLGSLYRIVGDQTAPVGPEPMAKSAMKRQPDKTPAAIDLAADPETGDAETATRLVTRATPLFAAEQ